MKILQVITSLRTGGAENLISEMVPLMRERGHEVDVLVFDGQETAFMRKLREKGVKVMALGMNVWVYRPQNIRRLMPIVKQYDIVHTHNTACQMYVAIAKKLSGAGCRLVTTEHNTDNRRRHIWWFKSIDRWMYRQYDRIVAISQQANDLLLSYIGPGFMARTIPNGVNVEAFHSADPHAEMRSKDDFVVIMVAAFRPQKDQDTLVKAMAFLPSKYKLWLVGGGDRKAFCEQLAQDLGVTDRVTFWGLRNDVAQMLKTADVVCMSTHYEGMSLSNIEGMAAGKPFVASRVNGITEITEGAGVMFEDNDEKELANIIERLATDSAYYDEVAVRCLQRAKQYDINKTVEGYCEVYAQLEYNEYKMKTI